MKIIRHDLHQFELPAQFRFETENILQSAAKLIEYLKKFILNAVLRYKYFLGADQLV